MQSVTCKFGYIDESGTMDDQEIMTVGLIVVHGQFVCRKVQNTILKSLYPKRFAEKKSKKDTRKSALELHYFELEVGQRAAAARILIGHNISYYCSYYYHDGNEKTHQERATIYKRMVKSCILSALTDHEELNIGIAVQGAAPAQRAEFMDELKAIPAGYREYRKVRYFFAGNTNEGVQLADFYVGATRDYFREQLVKDNELAVPYGIIEAQVRELILEYGVLVL